MKIIKRNKQAETFSVAKIKNALSRAFRATETRITNSQLNALCESILAEIGTPDAIEVETVQDIVETCLMANGYYKVAKAISSTGQSIAKHAK